MAKNRRPSRIAPLLALLGGAVIIVGCLLTWVDAGDGVSVGKVSVAGWLRGSELRLGQAALGAGVASVVLGILLLAVRRARKVMGLLVLLAGLVAIATAAYVYRSPEDRYADFAADTAAPAGQTDQVRASLGNLFEVSNLEANPGVGLYVVIGGGGVSVVAGMAGLFGRRKHAEPEDDLAELGPMVETGDEDHAAQGGPAPEMEEPSAEPEQVRETQEPMVTGEHDENAEPSEPEGASQNPPTQQLEPSDEPPDPPAERKHLGDEWAF
jgi:hypothetical protein